MPHPEHAVERLLGSTDGRVLLQGLMDLAGRPVAA
jgi:phosphoribosylformylglycinamidine (FGAM) synthase-like amidotransferase family enzyme